MKSRAKRKHYNSLFLTCGLLGLCAASLSAADHTHEHSMSQQPVHVMSSEVGMVMPAAAATRTVNVALTDSLEISFEPDSAIKQDEIIRFVVTNTGEAPHDFSISSLSERKRFVQAGEHSSNAVAVNPHSVTVAPGETQELVWHFMGKSRVVFACNRPGHAEAGMIRVITTEVVEGAHDAMDHSHHH